MCGKEGAVSGKESTVDVRRAQFAVRRVQFAVRRVQMFLPSFFRNLDFLGLLSPNISCS